MIAAVLGFNTAASGFVLSGALRAPVAPQAISMIDVGASCTGTCKWFDSSKGFGFIAVDGEESDISNKCLVRVCAPVLVPCRSPGTRWPIMVTRSPRRRLPPQVSRL